MTGVKPYVLRFWESEFEQIQPVTSSLGQKLYSTEDVQFISRLKKLLFEEKLTIEKAKSHILEGEEKDLPLEESENLSEVSLEKVNLKKLFMAKERLQKLLTVTGSLKQQHDWASD